MSDLPYQDLDFRLKAGIGSGFRYKETSLKPLHEALKQLSSTEKLHFSVDQLMGSSDPYLARLFREDNLSLWDCPPPKRLCMMNILTLLGFLWVHPSNFHLHFGQLLRAIWKGEADYPVEWHTFLEVVEKDLLVKTLDLYGTNIRLITQFIQSTYSLSNACRGEDIQYVYQIMKKENQENLPTLVGHICEMKKINGLIIWNVNNGTKVELKEAFSIQVHQFLQTLVSKQHLVLKLKGIMNEQGHMTQAEVMDILAVPSDRFEGY